MSWFCKNLCYFSPYPRSRVLQRHSQCRSPNGRMDRGAERHKISLLSSDLRRKRQWRWNNKRKTRSIAAAAAVSDMAKSRLDSDFARPLLPTSCWHENKGCVLVSGPWPKTQLLFCCQREVGNNVMCHPVVTLNVEQAYGKNARKEGLLHLLRLEELSL